jgi:hypothetical protein
LIPDLAHWSPAEKRAVARIVEAKESRRESEYVRLLRGHARLIRSLCHLANSVHAPTSAAT